MSLPFVQLVRHIVYMYRRSQFQRTSSIGWFFFLGQDPFGKSRVMEAIVWCHSDHLGQFYESRLIKDWPRCSECVWCRYGIGRVVTSGVGQDSQTSGLFVPKYLVPRLVHLGHIRVDCYFDQIMGKLTLYLLNSHHILQSECTDIADLKSQLTSFKWTYPFTVPSFPFNIYKISVCKIKVLNINLQSRLFKSCHWLIDEFILFLRKKK